VLLYAHHDVQPAGDLALWDSAPFEPTERAGRLYGRGAADDKAGLMAHVAALRAFGDDLPVGMIVFVEGEEEYGSASLVDLLAAHRDDLLADVIVIADSLNWDVGVPALTTSLRGIVNCTVRVRTLHTAVHSGAFGGAVPDGLATGRSSTLEFPVERLRAEAGVVGGVRLVGTGPIVDRLWTKPALSVLGLDAPAVRDAGNALVPAAAAKISIRLAPGDEPGKAFAALRDHLEAHRPWGAELSVEPAGSGAPCVIDTSGPHYAAVRAAMRTAWDGTDPVEIGVGGSIPAIATFQESFPDATIVVTGVEDPHTKAHGPNESLHLGEFARVCLAETLMLAGLGRLTEAPEGQSK
jgi:acetylornithine deacetylase/succinyl-diaminopimelate desuccinylase-like protein